MAVVVNVVGKTNVKQLQKAQNELDKLAGAGEKMSSRLGAAMGKVGKAVGGLALAAGAAVGTSLTTGFFQAMEREALADKLGAQLGLSPEQQEAMGRAAGELYANAYGDSLEQAHQAVGAVQSTLADALGNSETALTDATAQALDFASAFDVDVNRAVQSAGVLFRSGLAEDADAAFDQLVAASQKVPAHLREDMLDASDEYSQFFDQLGISGEESLGLLAEAAQGGVQELDKTGDALKELTIRATDMSTASVDAYEAAGLSAEDMASRFISGGDDARGALGDLVDGLQGIEDPVERANASIALFGTPIEDLGVQEIPDFLASLDNMDTALGDVEGAADRMGETLNDNLKTRLEGYKRRGLMALADAADKYLMPALDAVEAFMTNRVGPAVDTLRTQIEVWRPTLEQAFRSAREVVGTVVTAITGFLDRFRGTMDSNSSTIASWRDKAVAIFGQIQEVVASVFGALQAIFTTGINILTAFWDRFGKHLVDFLVRTVTRVVNIVSGVFDVLSGIFDLIKAVLTGQWGEAWEAIKKILAGAWRIIQNLVAGAWDALKTAFGAGIAAITQVWSFLWEQAKKILRGAWDAIVQTVRDRIDDAKATFDTIVDFVGGLPSRIASAASGMWDGITSAFKGAVNTIISGWNDLRFQIGGRTFDLPGPLGAITIPTLTLDTPNIPMLAQGGIATGPTLAMIGEGGRDEAVIPLPNGWRSGGGIGPQVSVSVAREAVVIHGAGADAGQLRRMVDDAVDRLASTIVDEVLAGAGAR